MRKNGFSLEFSSSVSPGFRDSASEQVVLVACDCRRPATLGTG